MIPRRPMPPREVKPEELEQLTQVFRRLGASDAPSWARSQLEEGIPQLAYFVFLKNAWQEILDEQNANQWFDGVLAVGAERPKWFYGQLARALQPVLARGVPRAELAAIIQLVQYDMLNALCFLLDEGGYSTPINVRQEEDNLSPVSWALHQVDENGQVIARLGGLHEYSDGEPPNGRESGFR